MRKCISVPIDLFARVTFLSLVCFAIFQPQPLKGQGATQFQHDCAACHALPGSALGPALSSTVGLRRSGWGPLVAVMDQHAGYGFTADIPAIAAYLDSLYPIASPAALPGGAAGLPGLAALAPIRL